MADYISQFTGSEIDQRLAKVPQVEAALAGKQATLVSGTNIKTINGQSVLGSGDMTIQAGDTDVVKYVAQTLTDAQKAQARANIDAASLADIADFDFVTVTSLPTASASTMGHIYLVGPDANDNYDRYYTQQSGSTYSWVALGSTEIDLSGYATQAELNQLEAKLYSFGGMLVPLLKKIAYKDDNAEQYVNAIDVLLNNDELVSISAVYTQPGAIYVGEPLDDLKDGLVVTAHYISGNEVVISSGYTLSGTLAAGTSPIMVTYMEMTASFNVAVTDALYYKDGSLFAPQVSARSSVTSASLSTSYVRDGVAYVYANSYTNGGGATPQKRCSYYLFDILVTAGKNYKYIFELDAPLGANQSILAAITYYNETFRQAGVANVYAAADHSGDVNATTWFSGTKDGNYLSFEDAAPTGYVGGRMSLKLQVSGTDSVWPETLKIKRFIVQELS